MNSNSKRLVSGIKPTGNLHLGNYFGAMKQMLDLQEAYECFIFVADLHALNQIQDAEALRRGIREIAVSYLAIGLDPNKVHLFQQSAVPAHAQLCWVFNSITSMGLLERAHAYKDARAKDKSVNVGLFDYPVLMAADILLYKPDIVPVGKDQQQHVEIAADIAGRFNHLYGETFKIPEALVQADVATVPGLDGRKMSKSYGNVIGLFDDPEDVRKKVFSIVTDSKRPDEPKDPDTCNIFALHKLVSGEQVAELAERYRAGTISYKESKEILAENIDRFLQPLREKRADILAKPGYLDDVLAAGAAAARSVADEMLQHVYHQVGL